MRLMRILFGIIGFKTSRSQNERCLSRRAGGFEAPVVLVSDGDLLLADTVEFLN